MKVTKEQKGITLVALVITIIVLLVLVVIVIKAVHGDEIIRYAQNTRDDYKQVQTIELDTIEENISKVETAMKIVPEELRRYILGEEKKGRSLTEIMEFDTQTQMPKSFKDEGTTIKEASKKVVLLALGIDNVNDSLTLGNIIYAKYNSRVYKIETDQEFNTVSIELIYVPEGKEGTMVKYDSNGDNNLEDWIILTDRGGKLEIVSAEAMGSLTLGGTDTEITNNLDKYLDINNDGEIDDLDGDGIIGGYGDIAIASYNNAITRINNYCKEIVTTEEDNKVRSIGASEETTGYYSSINFNSWFKNKEMVRAKERDTKYEEDLVKLSYFGIMGTGTSYWTASRLIYETYNSVDFSLRVVFVDGQFIHSLLWRVNSDGSVFNKKKSSSSVRPVVINPSNVQYP